MSLLENILKPLAAIFGSSRSKKKARKSPRTARSNRPVPKKTRTVKKSSSKAASASRRAAPKSGGSARRSSSVKRTSPAASGAKASQPHKKSSSSKGAKTAPGGKISPRKTSSQRVSRKSSGIVVSKTRSGVTSSVKTMPSVRTAGKAKAALSGQTQKRPVRSKEILVGDITHYFSRIQVAVLKMTGGALKLKESLHIRGTQTDFHQTVSSMQIESADVKIAKKGQLVGLKVEREVRVGDRVYKLE